MNIWSMVIQPFLEQAYLHPQKYCKYYFFPKNIFKGLKGEKGPTGVPGFPGQRGLDGRDGELGLPGEKGAQVCLTCLDFFPFQLTYNLMKGYRSFYPLKKLFLVSITGIFGIPDYNLCIYCVPIWSGIRKQKIHKPLCSYCLWIFKNTNVIHVVFPLWKSVSPDNFLTCFFIIKEWREMSSCYFLLRIFISGRFWSSNSGW